MPIDLIRGGSSVNLVDLQSQVADKTSHDNYEVFLKRGDLSRLFSEHDKSVVLTGDSLSFNLQDFTLVVGGNSAWSFAPGLMSWSHMLRDSIHRNDSNFVDARDIIYNITSTYENVIFASDNSTDKYVFPFAGRVLFMALHKDDVNSSINFRYKHNNPINKAVIYMCKQPNSYACLFDVYVDGTLKLSNIDNGGDNTKYLGREMFEVVVDCPGDGLYHDITLQNFRTSAIVTTNTNGNYGVTVNGLGSKRTKVYLTGEGGKTAQWIYENRTERILQYNPDFVGIICGANDSYQNLGASVYSSYMEQNIQAIRTQNPKTEILLLSSPSMGWAQAPDSQTQQYNDALKKLAIKYDCFFIDLIKLFKNMPTTLWRYDNTHFKKFGSTFLARNAISTLMPQGLYKKEYINASKYYSDYETLTLTFSNGWTNFGGLYPKLQYKVTGNKVRIFGDIKSGTTTTGLVIASIPSSINPKFAVLRPVTCLDASNVVSSGTVLVYGGALKTSYGIGNNNHVVIDFEYELT